MLSKNLFGIIKLKVIVSFKIELILDKIINKNDKI